MGKTTLYVEIYTTNADNVNDKMKDIAFLQDALREQGYGLVPVESADTSVHSINFDEPAQEEPAQEGATLYLALIITTGLVILIIGATVGYQSMDKQKKSTRRSKLTAYTREDPYEDPYSVCKTD